MQTSKTKLAFRTPLYVVAFVGALLWAAAVSAAAANLKMASGYPDANYLTQTVRDFIADVHSRSGGSLGIDLHNNQSLVKLPEMMRAVQTNQVALADVRLGNYGNQDPVYILDAIPFLAGDYDAAEKLWQASRPYLTASFEKRGMTVLFAMWNPPQGFYTVKPVAQVQDLEGLKLRVYSTETRRMGDLLKAEPLIVQFGEIPQAFSTGLINAMFTSPQTGIDTQAWDFVKNLTMVGALFTKQLVVINTDVFRKLSKQEQAALIDAGKAAEKAGFDRMKALTDEQLLVMRNKGVNVVQASPSFIKQLQQVGVQMEEDWKSKASAEQRKVLDLYLDSVKR
ncbi:TRAP transporter substrate-binding protein [uncultured Castellaniella sp.]|uniref:TRAP transporter substrate-binding protein n=1 Tax=uncultured Castellaniella sp. TaxID=647907 RepID=UPI0026370CEC|nr:TRAP transporter substrate-binding protein [uncultured Castellaniella sp.]